MKITHITISQIWIYTPLRPLPYKESVPQNFCFIVHPLKIELHNILYPVAILFVTYDWLKQIQTALFECKAPSPRGVISCFFTSSACDQV